MSKTPKSNKKRNKKRKNRLKKQNQPLKTLHLHHDRFETLP